MVHSISMVTSWQHSATQSRWTIGSVVVPVAATPRDGRDCGRPNRYPVRAIVAVAERISFGSRCRRGASGSIVSGRRGTTAKSRIARIYARRRDRLRVASAAYTTMATVRVLFFLSVTFLAFGGINAAPRKYDQRQEGEFNVHAQLENFLFVIAIPSNNDVLSELALQALELKHHLGSSNGIIPPLPLKDHESDATFGESNDEEVYITSTTTDAVQISEDRPDKKDPPQNAGEENTEVSSISSQQQQATTVSTDEKTRGEKAEDVVRAAKSAKSFKPTKSREMPVILGYLVDPRTLGFEMEDGGRARNVIRNVWNSEESGRPDTSMKKQLFRRGLDEQDIAPSLDTDESNAMFVGEKQQELRLLGDGIENCGPGRRRDASGLCEFDESDDSFV